jgi:Rieske Fe-S protein
MDESGILVNDTCSGSQYIILDGSVTKGPAIYALYAFKTNFDGETLHIYN